MEKKIIFLVLFSLLFIPTFYALSCNDEQITGLNYCYEINYDKTLCNSEYKNCLFNDNGFPFEGQEITYWPKIRFISSEELNKTQNLVLYYYLVDPSGKRLSVGYPIFIDGADILNGQEIKITQGIGVPSDYPGLWEIRTVLIDKSLFLDNVNGSTFGFKLNKDYDESLFGKYVVHIIPYSEELTKKLGLISLIVSFVLLFISFFMLLIELRIKPHKETEKQKDLFKSLYCELSVISNPEKKEEGNLQWFFNSIGKGEPLHSIWTVNVSPYMAGLPSKFEGNEIISIKNELVKINQKIEMINNVVLSGKYDLIKKLLGEKRNPDNQMRKYIKKVINETIGRIELIKKDLNKIIK